MPQGIQQEKSVTAVSGRSGLTDVAKMNGNFDLGQNKVAETQGMDNTNRDAVAPGGFSNTPGELAAKVDLEA